MLSTSYDKNTGVRTTTSRRYAHGASSLKELKKSLAKAKTVDEKNLANTGTIFIQKQSNDDNNADTTRGRLYAVKADFSSEEAKKKTEAIRKKAIETAKGDTPSEKPEAVQASPPPTRGPSNNS